MNAPRLVWSCLPLLSVACATARIEQPRSVAPFAGMPAARELPARNQSDAITEPGASLRPLRVRRPEFLQQGRSATQFRYEDNAESSAYYAAFAHGLFDDFVLDAQIGNGHQFETVSLAAEPNTLFDFGLQYGLVGERGDFRIAPRLDIVLSDESSFDPTAADDSAIGEGPLADRTQPAKVNFQPSLLFGAPLDDDGAEIYGLLGVRLGDATEPAFACGGGLVVPLGRVKFLLEADLVIQTLEPKAIEEAYLTPGLLLTLREKLDFSFGPSIGLTDDSIDWRVTATLGVRF